MGGYKIMFQNLSKNFKRTFDILKKQGSLSNNDVMSALREIRVSLLEADVSISVVKEFTESVKKKAIGHSVVKSVTPAQQVVKIIYDEIIKTLDGNSEHDFP